MNGVRTNWWLTTSPLLREIGTPITALSQLTPASPVSSNTRIVFKGSMLPYLRWSTISISLWRLRMARNQRWMILPLNFFGRWVTRRNRWSYARMCGKQVYTKTDVCVMDINLELLFLVQEDKNHINPADPEPQLVAKAITAFQANNVNRVYNLPVDPLPKQVFPGLPWSAHSRAFTKLRSPPTWICAYEVEHILPPKRPWNATFLAYGDVAAMGWDRLIIVYMFLSAIKVSNNLFCKSQVRSSILLNTCAHNWLLDVAYDADDQRWHPTLQFLPSSTRHIPGT